MGTNALLGPGHQCLSLSREAVLNLNHCIPVGTACDKGVWPFEAATRDGRSAQIPLKKPSSIPSEGGSSQCFWRMVGRVVSAAPWAAIRALCRQHFGKHIDRSQAGEAPEVLGGRRKEEFVLSSVWSSQTQTCQTKDSLEVSE
jgi:hypothetical protein